MIDVVFIRRPVAAISGHTSTSKGFSLIRRTRVDALRICKID
jgi:hypothetical protein